VTMTQPASSFTYTTTLTSISTMPASTQPGATTTFTRVTTQVITTTAQASNIVSTLLLSQSASTVLSTIYQTVVSTAIPSTAFLVSTQQQYSVDTVTTIVPGSTVTLLMTTTLPGSTYLVTTELAGECHGEAAERSKLTM
jgi:hypothetical protein